MAEARSVSREVAGSLPTEASHSSLCFTFQCDLPSNNNHRGKNSQSKLSIDYYQSLAHDADRSRVPRGERSHRCALQYFTLYSFSFETIYTRFDGFSTLIISFWLICTTRRWDRGSVWGHTLFLSELIFFLVSMRNPIF